MSDSTTTAVSSPSPTLRRHNSITAITPNEFHRSAKKPPLRTTSLDLELLLLKSPYTSYTSLRDMLPSPHASVNSPTGSSAAVNSGYEISIRNRLVKQAAWAYLQPMSSFPTNSSAPNFLSRLCHRFSSANSITSCFSSMVSGFTRIFRQILQAFRGQVRAWWTLIFLILILIYHFPICKYSFSFNCYYGIKIKLKMNKRTNLITKDKTVFSSTILYYVTIYLHVESINYGKIVNNGVFFCWA